MADLWWFGTWLDNDFLYIGNHHPNWLIFFQRLHHQPVMWSSNIESSSTWKAWHLDTLFCVCALTWTTWRTWTLRRTVPLHEKTWVSQIGDPKKTFEFLKKMTNFTFFQSHICCNTLVFPMISPSISTRCCPLAVAMSSRSGSAPFRGLLRAKCSVEEATLRQQQRLLDPLEMRRGCDLRHPEAGAERCGYSPWWIVVNYGG